MSTLTKKQTALLKDLNEYFGDTFEESDVKDMPPYQVESNKILLEKFRECLNQTRYAQFTTMRKVMNVKVTYEEDKGYD